MKASEPEGILYVYDIRYSLFVNRAGWGGLVLFDAVENSSANDECKRFCGATAILVLRFVM